MTDQPSAPQLQASPVKTSGLAIASLISSLCFFIPVVGPILGIVLGVVAFQKISSSRGALGGKGLAIAGIAIGGIFFLLTCALVPVALLLPAISKARDEARSVVMRNNMKQIGLAVLMYQNDHNGEMPADLQAVFDAGYAKDPELFTVPSPSSPPVDPRDIDGTGRFYYFQIRKPADAAEYPGDAPILWEKTPFASNGKVNVLYTSGRVYAGGRVALTDPQELSRAVDQHRDLYVKEPIMPAERAAQ